MNREFVPDHQAHPVLPVQFAHPYAIFLKPPPVSPDRAMRGGGRGGGEEDRRAAVATAIERGRASYRAIVAAAEARRAVGAGVRYFS